MVYLFLGYLVLWAITFGYVFSIAARQRRVQRELELLRQQCSALPEGTEPRS